MNDREKCLREACEIVNGARNQAYGNVEDNFDRIASLWSIYLDTAVTPIDVAMMMVLLKTAKRGWSFLSRTSRVDVTCANT